MKKNLKIWVLAGMLAFMAGSSDAAFQVGDSGAPIREVQRHLISAGYHVAADGAYGPATAEAVRHFQARKGLAADGIVGPATYRALTGKAMPAHKIIVKHRGGHVKGFEDGDFESYSWHPDAKEKRNVNWHTGEISSGTAREVTEEARKYIGIPYRFGGADTAGFDCSGFIQYVFRKKGMTLPRAADEQYGMGKKVSMSALRPGDLVFFSTYEKGVSHSGIYMGGGNFISATSSRGIAIADMTSGYWYDRYIGAKRIL